jgi:uncharacterized Ntn-hydrolase superfamily protein
LLVVKQGGGYGGNNGRHVDISIYDHANPIEELARCYQLHRLSYFPSDPDKVRPVTSDLAGELKKILTDLGYTMTQGSEWRKQDIASMARFMGVENYDNRIRNDARIDQEVLEDIREKYQRHALFGQQ